MASSNVVVNHSYRYNHTGALSTSSYFTYINGRELCRSLSMVTSNPIGVTATYYGVYNSVRIKRIQMWFAPPALDISAGQNPQGWTIGVTWTRVVDGASLVASKEVQDTALNTNFIAYVSATPPKTYLAGNWLGYNDSTTVLAFRTYPGTIIQIDLEAVCQDANSTGLVSQTSTVSTGVGVVCQAYLDDDAASGSRIFGPVGQEPALP